MQKQLTVILPFLCLSFLFACQSTEDCEKCTQPDNVYIYEKSANDWIKIYQSPDDPTNANLRMSFSQNPSEQLPLEVMEMGAFDQVVRIKSAQKNAQGGNKIEAKFKVTFKEDQLQVVGLIPGKTLIFKRIKAENLVLFLPVRKRVMKTGIRQSTFYRDKNIPADFYKNLGQVLCYYGEQYQEKGGKIYISALKYQYQEGMWNYSNKANDGSWLKENPCKK